MIQNQPITETQLSVIATDVQTDVDIVHQLLVAYKAKDFAKVLKILEAATPTVDKELTDIEQLIPVVKSGFKTTEFWCVVGLFAINFASQKTLGHTLPIDVNLVLGGVTGIYATLRHFAKKPDSQNGQH